MVQERARSLGFDAVGVARADVPLDQDFDHYRAFIDKGMHGEMAYLAANAEARRSLSSSRILEGARSVICLAMPYGRGRAEEARDPPVSRAIARYARGQDYHNHLRKRVRKLAAFVRSLGTPEAPIAARPLCDEEPVLERAWAARAGLGFVGKNGLLIVPGVGSFVLLGEVVTTLDLEPDVPFPTKCGDCTRCLDACPTQAFERPFVLDPRRCIAYLTIEHRSSIEPSLGEKIGPHVFGCDDCQTVCPYNARGEVFGAAARPAFQPHPRWASVGLADLLTLDESAFDALRRGSPIGRATRSGLARNAAFVLGHRAATGEALAPAEIAALRAAATGADAIVREAALWALEQPKCD